MSTETLNNINDQASSVSSEPSTRDTSLDIETPAVKETNSVF